MLLRGLGDVTAPDSAFWQSIKDTVSSIGTAINTYQINQANIQRAAQGLPPITSADVAPTVNVGLDPTLKVGLFIGGAVLLVALLARR